MNVNVILDSEYICRELSETNGAVRIANLLMFMKHKSNIIILQDKNQEIVRDILRQLAFNFEKNLNMEWYVKNRKVILIIFACYFAFRILTTIF